MKNNRSLCPLCRSLPRWVGRTLICRCGWYKFFSEKIEKAIEASIMRKMILISFLLLGFLVYLNRWGGDSFSLIPLKTKQWMNQLDKNSYVNLQNICTKKKRYDCAEKAHKSYFQFSGDLEVLVDLAQLQYLRKKTEEALRTYHQYFFRKGRNTNAAYNYARLLEGQGNTKFALAYYKYALLGKSGATVQLPVMRSYISLLFRSGQTKKAKTELLKMSSFFKNANPLIQQEYKRWSIQFSRS